MSVIMTRDGGDFTRTRRLGPARFEHAVRKELTRRGKIRPCLRILRKLYAALADPAGVIAHRPGAFERIGWLVEDWDTARAKLADTEARMVAVLDDLELTELACSIQGCLGGTVALSHPDAAPQEDFLCSAKPVTLLSQCRPAGPHQGGVGEP